MQKIHASFYIEKMMSVVKTVECLIGYCKASLFRCNKGVNENLMFRKWNGKFAVQMQQAGNILGLRHVLHFVVVKMRTCLWTDIFCNALEMKSFPVSFATTLLYKIWRLLLLYRNKPFMFYGKDGVIWYQKPISL